MGAHGEDEPRIIIDSASYLDMYTSDVHLSYLSIDVTSALFSQIDLFECIESFSQN